MTNYIIIKKQLCQNRYCLMHNIMLYYIIIPSAPTIQSTFLFFFYDKNKHFIFQKSKCSIMCSIILVFRGE